MPLLSGLFSAWRVNMAWRILRWVEQHTKMGEYWYPKLLLLHLDETKEWLVDCQKLIAVAEWIREGAVTNIVAILCEGQSQDPDTPQYLKTVDDLVRTMIGESCVNAHQLVVSYENKEELNETASAVIQCCGLGILSPNTVVVEMPKSGNAANFINPNESELWGCIAATIDKYLIVCKGDLWKPVPAALQSTMDLWWVVENDDHILEFVYYISRCNRWTFTKLRIFALLKENEMDYVKESVVKRITEAKLEYRSLQLKALPNDELCTYASAETETKNGSNRPVYMSTFEQNQALPLVGVATNPTLNNLIRASSSTADLVMVNLPRAKGETTASRLRLSLDTISNGLSRVVVFRPPMEMGL